MTQQTYPNSQEAASSSSSGSVRSSTSTADAFPLPFSIGQKKIMDDDGRLVANLADNNVVAPAANICVNDSSHITFGNRTIFNEGVTIYQYIDGNHLPQLQNDGTGQDEVECNKSVHVVSPPSPPASPSTKPAVDFFKRHFKAIMILLTIATVICAATLITFRLVAPKKSNFTPSSTTEAGPTTTERPSPNLTTFYNKSQWGGKVFPNQKAMDQPVGLVIVKHTKTKSCDDVPTCSAAMRDMQINDVDTDHLKDIRYNFVIGGDGNVYEGRAWGVQNEQMNNTIDIAYMGDFNVQVPSDLVVAAGNVVVVKGIVNGHLDYSATKVVCHNQTENVDSPVRVVSPPLPPASVDKPQNPVGLYRRPIKISLILVTIATAICATTFITLWLVGTKEASFVSTTTEEPITTVPQPLKIHYAFNKSQWGGRELPNPETINHPVHLVIIKHTKTNSCEDPPSCFSAMQDMQNIDVGTKHLRDIRYNFVIGGDGNIYEGRGWHTSNEQMNNTIDIAYMGDFNVQVPSDWVVGAGYWWTIIGMDHGYLDTSNLRVVCHNQTENTDSPGVNLFKEVVKWDIYSNDIINGTQWTIGL